MVGRGSEMFNTKVKKKKKKKTDENYGKRNEALSGTKVRGKPTTTKILFKASMVILDVSSRTGVHHTNFVKASITTKIY